MRHNLRRVLVWSAVLVLFQGRQIHAHEIDVHREITRVALQYLGSPGIESSGRFSNPATLNKLQALFYDPVAKEDDDFGSPDIGRFLFHFLPQLDGDVNLLEFPAVHVSGSCTSLKWGFGDPRPLCRASSIGLPVDKSNSNRWQEAFTNAHGGSDNLDGWRNLGYVIHLLEDLTSPAHVRNDPHPHYGEISFDDFDPVEYWNKTSSPPLPTGGLKTPQDVGCDTSALKTQIEIAQCAELFLVDLAKWTRKNFFSKNNFETVYDKNTNTFEKVGPSTRGTSHIEEYFYGDCLPEVPCPLGDKRRIALKKVLNLRSDGIVISPRRTSIKRQPLSNFRSLVLWRSNTLLLSLSSMLTSQIRLSQTTPFQIARRRLVLQ